MSMEVIMGTIIKKALPLENNCVGKLANGKLGTKFCTRIKCKILCNFFLLAFSAKVFIALPSDKLQLLNLWEEYMKRKRKVKFKELLRQNNLEASY